MAESESPTGESVISNQVVISQNFTHDFEILMSENVNGHYPVTKYRSKSTGLTLVHAHIIGPIVYGYIALATKAEDNDGLPHTLEHLVFLGSEDYPYPQVLDACALKSLSDGTNAWTSSDHTCYSMVTCGAESVCQILPIFMDHIFYPTLTESGYLTEVHHINGKGEDGGVIYSEIQADENDGGNLISIELKKHLYPLSSYRCDTGGVMKNLRESTNLEKVKEFHKKYYNPKNACVIVCGEAEPTDLFKSLDSIVQKFRLKGDVPNKWTCPWLDLNELPVLKTSVEKTITYPGNDDDPIMISIAFQGPSILDQFDELNSLSLILGYLFSSSIAPFQKAFVENENPLASSIGVSSEGKTRTVFQISLNTVPKERINEVLPLVKKVLEEESDFKKFDLKRMKDIIHNYKVSAMVEMENTPCSTISGCILTDFLFGNDDEKRFKGRFESISPENFDKFFLKSQEFWTDLMKNLILNVSWITIVAIPSKDDQKKLVQGEKTRIHNRCQKLGKNGLKELGDKLETAILENSKPIPKAILQSIKLPDLKKLTYHKINRFEDPDFAQCECKVLFDDIETSFFLISILMDTTSLKPEYRKYLPLFSVALTENPIKLDNGILLDFEKVVWGLSRDTIDCDTSFGIDGSSVYSCGDFGHIFALDLMFELEKIEKGFDWIHRLLWNVEWSSERLKILANSMSLDIPGYKRSGGYVAASLMEDIIYKNDSNVKATCCFRQQNFLQRLADSLDSEKPKKSHKQNACFCPVNMTCRTQSMTNIFADGQVFEIFNEILEVCRKPSNMTIQIIANRQKLAEKGVNLSELLSKSLNFQEKGIKRIANEFDYTWMKDFDELFSTPCKELIMGIVGEDSGHLKMIIPGIKSLLDPSYPALAVAIEYFCQTGGPLYKAIRGGGFAYDFSISKSISEGLICFNLAPCSDTVGAYRSAYNVIKSHLENDKLWDAEILVSAKSSYIFDLIDGTPLGLAETSLQAYYRKVPGNFYTKLIKKISQVDMDQVKEVTKNYLANMFLKKNHCIVVCPKDKVNKHISGFKEFDKKLKVLPLIDNCSLYKWPKPEN